MTTALQAFWIDEDYDRANASDRESRFNAYVSQARKRFEEIENNYSDPQNKASAFAQQVWRTATSPVMAPGLIRFHPRITGASVERSEWDGSLLGTADIISELPQALRDVRTGSGDWFRSWRFNEWAKEYEGIGDRDLEKGGFLLPSVRVAVPLSLNLELAGVPAELKFLQVTAWQYVRALVPAMNRQIQSVITALEEGR